MSVRWLKIWAIYFFNEGKKYTERIFHPKMSKKTLFLTFIHLKFDESTAPSELIVLTNAQNSAE